VWAAIARAVRVGQRDLVLTGPLQLFQHVLASRASRADRGDLFGQVLDPRAGWCGFGGVALVEPLQVIVELGIGEFDELRQRGAGEVAVLVVDRFDPGAIDREQFPAKQVQLTAEQHELAEDRAEGVAVVAAEIGDGLKVGPEVAQQPDHLDVAMALGFEPAARPDAVEVAVDVEFQQIVGCVAWAPGWLGRDTDEPAAVRSNPSTKASMKRTGLSWPTYSSSDSGNNSVWDRSGPEMCVMIRILTLPASIRNPLRDRFHTVCKNSETCLAL
jgi:hypothetical protein